MPIKKIYARQIFDSRGNPTVEVELTTELGIFTAAVPSGASTGAHEAIELRDNDKAKYHGKSVSQACANVNTVIAPRILAEGAKLDVTKQSDFDAFLCKLDGTENKKKLGANAILGVSLAAARAGAAARKLPLYRHIAELAENRELILPVPAFNVINGGTHAGNRLAMQEFMILPTGARTFAEAMRMGTEVYHHLKAIIKKRYGLDATAVGDEGGFAPNINAPPAQSNKEALELVKCAIDAAGYSGSVDIGMDVAASEFFKDGKYDLDFKNDKNDKTNAGNGSTGTASGGGSGTGGGAIVSTGGGGSGGGGASRNKENALLTSRQLACLYWEFIRDFPVITIEDPFEQDEWDAWRQFTASVNIQVIGDDLTVTNAKRIETAASLKACNCLLLKVNQIGTLSEAIRAHQLAKSRGWSTMVSHRSGETEDTFIADLAVALGCGQIKAGAPCRSERTAKYNQLLRIEEQLGDGAKYAGKNFRNPQAALVSGGGGGGGASSTSSTTAATTAASGASGKK